MLNAKTFVGALQARSPFDGMSKKQQHETLAALVELNQRKRAVSVPLTIAQQMRLGKEHVEEGTASRDTWFFTSQVSRQDHRSVLHQNMVLVEKEPPRDDVFLAKEELTRMVRALECPEEWVDEVVNAFLTDYHLLKKKLELVMEDTLKTTSGETMNGLFKQIEQTIGVYLFVSAGKQIV